MNKVILMGRLTRDPEVRYSQGGENPLAIARFTLAVDRRFKRDGEATADFINCVAVGRQAEHAERFYRLGLKVVITGRIVVEEQEFAESKAVSDANAGGYRSAPTPAPAPAPVSDAGDGFMNIPDGIDEELPFS